MRRRSIASGLAVAAVAVLAGCGPGRSDPTASATAVTWSGVRVTNESYGPDPQQMVTVSRRADADGKTVIFLHGGSWLHGSRASLNPEAATWARNGWVSIDVDYRLGRLDHVPGDGRAILADVQTVLTTYRAEPYVDPKRIVVYGESAGGHLATWLGAYRGDQIAATIAFSPVSSISGAIAAGRAPGAVPNVRLLGRAAQEFFGYSPQTTDAHAYLNRAGPMFIVVSTHEWVDPAVHGVALCRAFGRRCHLVEYPGTAHASIIVTKHPEVADQARAWADAQLRAAPTKAGT